MTETETLEDVLRDLAELRSCRFGRTVQDLGRVTVGGGLYYEVHCTSRMWHALIQVACQQECEAQGWFYRIDYDPKESGQPLAYTVEIMDPTRNYTLISEGESSDSPALAIGTALREALGGTA